MFLTQEELKTLTGYKLPVWQIRWLESHGYKHEQAANGRPVVLRAYAESRLSGIVQEQGWKPNLEAIRKVA